MAMIVQVMKDAFAMRSNLGDPGLCTANSVHGQGMCFQDMQPILSDMLAPVYAEKLRCPMLAVSAVRCTSCITCHPAVFKLIPSLPWD